jgi:Predicted integral membrane protein
MYIDRIGIKLDAKEKIRSAVNPPYKTTIVYLVLMSIIVYISRELNSRFDVWATSVSANPYINHFTTTLFYSGIFLMILSILSDFISMGYDWYTLRISRLLPASFSNMFDTFNIPLKVLGLSIAMSVFIYLWSLLLVIPGLIAAYSYRQAVYILFDHPDYTIMQCISESKAMMRGHKGELFILDLSFLGWVILCVLTMGILFVWMLPYMQVTYANYYNALIGSYAHGGNEYNNNNL